MSRSRTSFGGLKRTIPDSGPPGHHENLAILNAIKSRRDSGIWLPDIKRETKLTDHVVKRSLNALMSKNLIKELVDIRNKRKKCYMSVEFEPSSELTGGEWYVDGRLDTNSIDVLKRLCFRFLRAGKVTTLEGVYDELNKVSVDIPKQRVGEILNLMVLNNDVIEVKSTGLGDYHSIPIGTVCYRVASGLGLAKGAGTGAYASIPCGVCPRINMCAPDGVISPTTCVYYKKWLSIDF